LVSFSEKITVSTGAIAAAAAAEAARLRNQEEEEMTQYSEKELAEGWEFKILRSNLNAFRKPENLQRYLEEEGRAGWVLVEKFDDGRIRLKRPAGVQRADAPLNFDPYRTQVGTSSTTIVLVVVGVVLGVAFVALLVPILILVLK
jgi:hypothetical protein